MCTSSLTNANTRTDALDCLVRLCQLPACLDGDELVFALQSMTNLLVKPEANGGEDIAEEALQGLRELASIHPKEVEENVMPPLFGLLPNTAPSKQDTSSIDAYKLALACLTTLGTVQPLFETLLIRLLARLDTALAPKATAGSQHAQDALYAHHLLTALRIVLEKKVAAGHIDIAMQAQKLCSRLYARFIPPALVDGATTLPALEPKIIDDAGRIIMLLVQQIDQRYVIAILVQSLLPG